VFDGRQRLCLPDVAYRRRRLPILIRWFVVRWCRVSLSIWFESRVFCTFPNHVRSAWAAHYHHRYYVNILSSIRPVRRLGFGLLGRFYIRSFPSAQAFVTDLQTVRCSAASGAINFRSVMLMLPAATVVCLSHQIVRWVQFGRVCGGLTAMRFSLFDIASRGFLISPLQMARCRARPVLIMILLSEES
jgi:hypothetical protein